MSDQFSRTRLMLGDEAVERLRRAKVIVFGIGGVGGFAAEALARGGIGRLEFVDSDVVSLGNLNRQLIALHSTIGRAKAELMAERVRDINPDCELKVHKLFYLPGEGEKVFRFSDYDYIVDAVDTVSAKLALVEEAKRAGVSIISAMGAGNKLDPTAFSVADIYETSVCPLARVMRRELRKRGISSLKVVYSREKPVDPEREEGEDAAVLPGSVSFVPSVAGMILGGEVIRDILGIERRRDGSSSPPCFSPPEALREEGRREEGRGERIPGGR